jgi:hypothetical protein
LNDNFKIRIHLTESQVKSNGKVFYLRSLCFQIIFSNAIVTKRFSIPYNVSICISFLLNWVRIESLNVNSNSIKDEFNSMKFKFHSMFFNSIELNFNLIQVVCNYDSNRWCEQGSNFEIIYLFQQEIRIIWNILRIFFL